jgi:hypothetical protein
VEWGQLALNFSGPIVACCIHSADLITSVQLVAQVLEASSMSP